MIADLKGSTEVIFGADALSEVASNNQVDIVMAAIVGAAGLLPTLSAVESGKKVLLANKESLVMAGSIFMSAVKQNGATLLPIDSEHNAIFQCLPHNYSDVNQSSVKKLILSASGDPLELGMQKRLPMQLLLKPVLILTGAWAVKYLLILLP